MSAIQNTKAALLAAGFISSAKAAEILNLAPGGSLYTTMEGRLGLVPVIIERGGPKIIKLWRQADVEKAAEILQAERTEQPDAVPTFYVNSLLKRISALEQKVAFLMEELGVQ